MAPSSTSNHAFQNAAAARRVSTFLLVNIGSLALAALSGCATASKPDPIEPLNRQMFALNEHLDRAFVKPVATGYAHHVPTPVKTGVSNFFDNAEDLWSAANLVLQGQVGDAARVAVRFGLNTTVGLLGIFDVATSHGLERHHETFGKTLGAWVLQAGCEEGGQRL